MGQLPTAPLLLAAMIVAAIFSGTAHAAFCLNGPGPHNVDTDGDGFADCEDNCPLQPNDQADADANGVGDACDCGLAVTPGSASSLSSAINNAADGCAILVPPGTYSGLSYDLDHEVSLFGAGATQTILQTSGGTVVHVRPAAGDVFVGGMSIDAPGNGGVTAERTIGWPNCHLLVL